MTKQETTGAAENENSGAWAISFVAAMVPFTAFCYGHSRGMTAKVVEAVVKSRVGPGGLLLLPFVTLAMEKSIYDTVQAAQGINPNVVPTGRVEFPSGGAALPSFSLIPVQCKNMMSVPSVVRRLTAEVQEKKPLNRFETTKVNN
jgi:hypothetical protein